MSSNRQAARKRVLMLCYHFPPVRSSGTTRSVEFARRLAEFGWEPLVLTVSRARDRWVGTGAEVPADVEIVRSFEWDLTGVVEFCNGVTSWIARLLGRELERNFYRLLTFPDPQIAWFSTLAGARLARRCDCIYVSCSPFSSAISACWVKHLSGRPLVVDFRDAWSLNPHHRFGRWERALTRLAESYVLRCADRLVVNTEGARRLYRKAYPADASRVVAIPNGYDEIILPRTTGSARFTIMHVGSFYGSRQPRELMEALCRIDDPAIEFVQVGESCEVLDEYEDRLHIRQVGSVPRDAALDMMRSASLLYLKQGFEGGAKDYIAVGAKTYEYLATGLPILADCPPGDNADLIERFCSHPYVVTTNSADDLFEAVMSAKEARASLEPRVCEEFVRTFDRRALTARLAAVFDDLAGSGRDMGAAASTQHVG